MSRKVSKGGIQADALRRGLEFWTQNQTVTAFWRSEDASHQKADVAMPVHN